MPAIAAAKLSVVSVLRKCALNKKDRLLLYLFEWVLAAWITASEIVKICGCSLAVPWLHLNVPCINRVGHLQSYAPSHTDSRQSAWVIFFMSFNCGTELWLITIPTLNILRLPTTWDKKLLAICLFGSRIVYVS
jgi:hypothetical protein